MTFPDTTFTTGTTITSDWLNGVNDAIVDGSANINYIPPFPDSVTTTVGTKLSQTVSVTDFGAVGDGVTDDLPAFQAAIASFDVAEPWVYGYGGTINVPPGNYYLSDTLEIARNIKLVGAGAPYGNDVGSSILYFASNVDGIWLPDYRGSTTGKQGAGLVIEGLTLSPKTTGGTTGSGIFMQTTARLINVRCVGWPEHGIKIDASTSYTPASNANVWYLNSCTTSSNGKSGLYVNGADANAGTCIGHNSVQNGEYGLYDNSFLGNTYVGCHSSSNTLAAYKSLNLNAQNTYVGCYSEADQPPSIMSQRCTVLGGLHAAGFTNTAFGWFANFNGTTWTPGLNTTVNTSGGTTLTARFNQAPNNDEIYSFARNDSNSGVFSKMYANTDTRFDYDNSDLRVVYYTTGPLTTSTFGRSSTLPYAFYPFKLVVGANSSVARRLSADTAAPTAGDWARGDIVYNTNATSGGYAGWICTTGGTPGTWKTFGLIS